MSPAQPLIPLLLCVLGSPQLDGFDLDEYLATQNPPTIAEIFARLGPEPGLDALVDADREFVPPPAVEPTADNHSDEHVLRLEEIGSWTAKIDSLRKAGDHLESARWAGKLAEERQMLLRPGHPLIAQSYGHLSFALYNLNRNREARDMTLAALDIELEEYGRVNYRVRESLIRLSKRCERLSDGATGETALRHALDIAILSDGPTSKAAARIQSNLGAKLSDQGKDMEAIEVYERCLQIYEELEGPSSNSVAIVCANLAQILIPMGEPEWALDLLTRAVDIHRDLEQLDSKAAIVCMFVMADLCPPTQALEYMEEAIGLAKDVLAEDDAIWPTLWNQYGWGLVQARELDTAEEPLRRALEIQTKRYGTESVKVANIMNNLAGLMQLRGQKREALELFQESFDIKRRYAPRNHPSLVKGWNNLGVLHSELRQYDEAQVAWREALDLCREILPPVHEETARILTNYGTLLYKVKRYQDAVLMLRRGVEMRRKLLGDHPSTATSESSLAQALVALGKLEEASALLDKAENTHRASLGASGLGLPSVLRIRTLVHRSRNEREAACQTSREAFEIIDAQKVGLAGTPAEEALFAEAISHGSLAALHAATLIDVGRHEEALVVFERARGRMLLDLLNQRHAESDPWNVVDVAPPSQVQEELRAGERIRAYFWSSQGLLFYEVGPETIHARVLAWGAPEIAELGRDVKRYTALLADPTRVEEQDALGRRLVEALWPETDERPDRWILLPDGPLQGLPFNALPLPGDKQAEFIYASSSTLYSERCRVARSRTAGQTTRLVAVGDPAYSTASQLPPLRGTRTEVQNASQLVRAAGGDSQLLMGEEATLTAVKEHSKTCTVLHLATHGQAAPHEDPLGASLALAPNMQGPSDLTLRVLFEEWQGQLANCELVVLSACETQKAAKVGESLMALSWGFFYAGTPTVLATLWKVDDRATALLMGKFYESLLENKGGSKLSALTQAQLWLRDASRREIRAYERELGLDEFEEAGLRSPGGVGEVNRVTLRPYSDPAYWAGFVLLGAPD